MVASSSFTFKYINIRNIRFGICNNLSSDSAASPSHTFTGLDTLCTLYARKSLTVITVKPLKQRPLGA